MEPLDAIFDHHRWATLALFDHCLSLPADVLESSVPGTMGSIADTLRHIVRANGGYLARLQHRSREPLSWIEQEADLTKVRQAFEEQHREWLEVLRRIDTVDVTIDPEPETGWPGATHAANLMVAQAIHHGNDHRTHICTILGATGQEVPDLDVWSYWAEVQVPRRAS